MKQAWILATCLLAALATVQANSEAKRDPSTIKGITSIIQNIYENIFFFQNLVFSRWLLSKILTVKAKMEDAMEPALLQPSVVIRVANNLELALLGKFQHFFFRKIVCKYSYLDLEFAASLSLPPVDPALLKMVHTSSHPISHQPSPALTLPV